MKVFLMDTNGSVSLGQRCKVRTVGQRGGQSWESILEGSLRKPSGVSLCPVREEESRHPGWTVGKYFFTSLAERVHIPLGDGEF